MGNMSMFILIFEEVSILKADCLVYSSNTWQRAQQVSTTKSRSFDKTTKNAKNNHGHRCAGSTWTYITQVIKAGLTSGMGARAAAATDWQTGVTGQGRGCVRGRAFGVRCPGVPGRRGPARPDGQARGSAGSTAERVGTRCHSAHPTARDAVSRNSKRKGGKTGQLSRTVCTDKNDQLKCIRPPQASACNVREKEVVEYVVQRWCTDENKWCILKTDQIARKYLYYGPFDKGFP